MFCEKLGEFGETPNVKSRAIPSQAKQQCLEGVETRRSNPMMEETPTSPQRLLFRDEDIVRTKVKALEIRDKEL